MKWNKARRQVHFLRHMGGYVGHMSGHVAISEVCSNDFQTSASVRMCLDAFTVSLHSPNGRHLPAVRAMQGDCQWFIKTMEIPNGHTNPQKGRCQSIGSHVSSLTDSRPAATRLGLCSSLVYDANSIY